MSKRTPMDKEQVRMRRNRLLERAAAAELSLTEAVREMRAIAGMTQEEFARHRGVSARVIKAIETGQANPTVATLNQIGQFFGLEVGFVPIRRTVSGAEQPALTSKLSVPSTTRNADATNSRAGLHAIVHAIEPVVQSRKHAVADLQQRLSEAHAILSRLQQEIGTLGAVASNVPSPAKSANITEPSKARGSKKRKSDSP